MTRIRARLAGEYSTTNKLPSLTSLTTNVPFGVSAALRISFSTFGKVRVQLMMLPEPADATQTRVRKTGRGATFAFPTKMSLSVVESKMTLEKMLDSFGSPNAVTLRIPLTPHEVTRIPLESNRKQNAVSADGVRNYVSAKKFGLQTVELGDLPDGLSSADLLLNYHGTLLKYSLNAGFVGITQDRQTLALCPQINWFIIDTKQAPDAVDLESYTHFKNRTLAAEERK